MSPLARTETANVVQGDVRPDEQHCSDCRRSNHHNKLKDLTNLHVPMHELTPGPTTSGPEYLLPRDQTPENSVQEMTAEIFDGREPQIHAPESLDHCSLRSSTQPQFHLHSPKSPQASLRAVTMSAPRRCRLLLRPYFPAQVGSAAFERWRKACSPPQRSQLSFMIG